MTAFYSVVTFGRPDDLKNEKINVLRILRKKTYCYKYIKYKALRTVMNPNYVLGGGLEPAFRVLFSAIFHEFRSGISIGAAICGKEWNQNCSFLSSTYLQNFHVFGPSLPSTGSEESQYNALSSAHHSLRRNSARRALGI